MIHQFTEEHRECTDVGRHEQIGTACGLRAALEDAVVHRPHLIGMVAEICGAACIIEREHSTDEQGTLVMAGGEWSAEGGTCFSVCHITVGKEYAALSCETICNLACFTHETVFYLCTVEYG